MCPAPPVRGPSADDVDHDGPFTGPVVLVEVEVPKGGFVKRLGDGRVDYVSPLPSPFNYGAIPDTHAADGDRDDVVLLGPRQAAGTRVRSQVRAVVRFVDAGDRDDKLVCSPAPLTPADRRLVWGFFVLYARAKTLLNLARGRRGPTRVERWDEPPPAAAS